MNRSSHSEPLPAMDIPTKPSDGRSQVPLNWREALLVLVSARIGLIEMESKELAGIIKRRVMLLGAALICAVFAWALLLVGGIGCICKTFACAWDEIAIAVGAVHFVVVMLLFLRVAKSRPGMAFPVTRAEFQKDREWIHHL